MQGSTTQFIDALLDKHQITDPTKREFFSNTVLRDSVSYFSKSLSDVNFTSPERNTELLRLLTNKQQNLFVVYLDKIEDTLTAIRKEPGNQELQAELSQVISQYHAEARALTNSEVQSHLWQILNDFASVLKQYRADVSQYISRPDHNPTLGNTLAQDRANIIKINNQLFALGKNGAFSQEDILEFKTLFNKALNQIHKSQERVALFNNPEASPAAEPESSKKRLISKAIEGSILKLMQKQNISAEHQEFYSKNLGPKILEKLSEDIANLGAVTESPQFAKKIETEYQQIFKGALEQIEPLLTRRAALYELLTTQSPTNDPAKIFDNIKNIGQEIDAVVQDAIVRNTNMVYTETKLHTFHNPLNEKMHRLEFLSDNMFKAFKQSIIDDPEYTETLNEANNTLRELFYKRSKVISNIYFSDSNDEKTALERQLAVIEEQVDITIQNASTNLNLHVNKKTASYLSQTSMQLLITLSEFQKTMQTEFQAFKKDHPKHLSLQEIAETVNKSSNSLYPLIQNLRELSFSDLSDDNNIESLRKIFEDSIKIVDNCRKDIQTHQKLAELNPELYEKASFFNKVMAALEKVWVKLCSLFASAQSAQPQKPRGPMTFSNTNSEPTKNNPRPQAF